MESSGMVLSANDIRTIMELRQDEYTEEKPMILFTGTWNVNAKKPKENLEDWLTPKDSPTPDIYAIGMQEIVDLNASNLVVSTAKQGEMWMEEIKRAIGSSYKIVAWKPLVGILLLVFVHEEHHAFVCDTQWDTVGVGVMGVAGNKGGVAIRFKIYNTPICIVCSHLAAHQNNVEGRNSDFHNIFQRLRFDGLIRDNIIKAHDYLFWIGDLNYRLNFDDIETVYELIDEKNVEKLLENDQLLLERSNGKVFEGFREGKITFLPTYKYQPGTNRYERRPEKKIRLPAWCDRILWIGDRAEQLSYFRSELVASDHKPVSAVFKVPVKVKVREKELELYQSLIKENDSAENDRIAKVTISETQVHFGSVRYDTPVERTITIFNHVDKGKIDAKFNFAPKTKDSAYCQSWLSISPSHGTIHPGESKELKLTVHVQKDSAAALNTGKDLMEDILILKLENGMHYFISVTADYQKSCFGCQIDFLVHVPTPIRFYQKESFVDTPAEVLALPKELWRIVDYIFRHGLGKKGLFLKSGNTTEIDIIRECLDTGEEFPPKTSYTSMASVLLKFLDSFSLPVYPLSLLSKFKKAESKITFARQSLLHLPLPHYNVFIYIISFLREVLRRCDPESRDSLVEMFTRSIMQVQEDSLSVLLECKDLIGIFLSPQFHTSANQ